MPGNNVAYAWGGGAYGQRGDNTTTAAKSSPVLVVGAHSFTQVAAGMFNSLGLKADGSAWSWGDGGHGGLGDQTTVSKSSPVLVVGNHVFTQIALAGNNTDNGTGQSYVAGYGLKPDGSVWSWGFNNTGQLGDNTITDRSSPVLVVGAHSFTDIYGCLGTAGGGGSFAAGRKADGSVWTWGFDNTGSLGGHATSSSPALVVGVHSFVEVSLGVAHGMGLKANGQVWCWGYNGFGNLGNQSTTDRTSPVLVVGAHSFTHIAASGYTSVAIKADGSAWAWGNNAVGSIGDNTTTAKSSPVLVVGAHSFVSISRGYLYTIATKADGTSWGWGANSGGQLGDNTTTAKSSPVLIVGAFVFAAIGAGDTHAIGIYGLPDTGPGRFFSAF